jgi:hypothetical protein
MKTSSLAIVVVVASSIVGIGLGLMAARDEQKAELICFDSVQGFRRCASAPPPCTTDTDCMQKFGGDGGPEPVGL